MDRYSKKEDLYKNFEEFRIIFCVFIERGDLYIMSGFFSFRKKQNSQSTRPKPSGKSLNTPTVEKKGSLLDRIKAFFKRKDQSSTPRTETPSATQKRSADSFVPAKRAVSSSSPSSSKQIASSTSQNKNIGSPNILAKKPNSENVEESEPSLEELLSRTMQGLGAAMNSWNYLYNAQQSTNGFQDPRVLDEAVVKSNNEMHKLEQKKDVL